jgi:hypothetical protein
MDSHQRYHTYMGAESLGHYGGDSAMFCNVLPLGVGIITIQNYYPTSFG